MEWSNWLPALILNGILVIGVYAARNLIKSSIEKGVQHGFDQKLEAIRTDHRISEAVFNNNLRAKETEIAALRGGALGGLANRQALLEKRRLEAVERIWTAVVDLSGAKIIAATMSITKYEAAAEEAARNPKFREIFEMYGRSFNLSDYTPSKAAQHEQPFVSPIIWALFTAYQTILLYAVCKNKMLEIGVEDASRYMDVEGVKKIIRASLPHQSNYIDKFGDATYYHLLGELEQDLIAKLRSWLKGEDLDETNLEQAAAILTASAEYSDGIGA